VVQFTDLVGCTAISEALDAEDVREIVMQYQRMADEVIKESGGHIAQFLGDGILTYFGFPVAHEDAAVCSCHAALGILAGLDQLNADLRANGVVPPTPVTVRLGIHAGSVVIGEMGGGNCTETVRALRLLLPPSASASPSASTCC